MPLIIGTMVLVGGVIGAINGIAFVYGRLPHPFIFAPSAPDENRGPVRAPRLGGDSLCDLQLNRRS